MPKSNFTARVTALTALALAAGLGVVGSPPFAVAKQTPVTIPPVTTPTVTVPALTIPPVTVPAVTTPAVTIPALAVPSAPAAARTMFDVVNSIGARSSWNAGYTGKDVAVVLIDSGMAPVPGIDAARVMNGPDLSFDAANMPEEGSGLDTYGHGTHMAGIIGGRDAGASLNDPTAFIGVAPDVKIINIKVGSYDGATDVSQVIAAINWAVENQKAYNIKAINLSYGTESLQDWMSDPLSWAAEVAWRRGITVVAAVGNDGSKSSAKDPSFNPTILAVGASEAQASAASYSATRGRKPDVSAPGSRIQSLRVPGSAIDDQHPSKSGDRFIRGSGTSQATAVVTGAVALLSQEFPTATPDDLKSALMSSLSKKAKGGGSIDLALARASLSANLATGQHLNVVALTPLEAASRGRGSLSAARGSSVVLANGQPLSGDVDAFGNQWNAATWSADAWSGRTWASGRWNGNSWTGASWLGMNWLANSWAGHSWSAGAWSGHSWSGSSWLGHSWSGHSWSAKGWVGHSWSGHSWSGNAWLSSDYSSNDWSGFWDV